MEYSQEFLKREDKRYLYIVEGVTDEDKLKKIGCLYVLPCGGKYIRADILSFIKEVSKVRNLVLVLDPDGPGRSIEKKIVDIVEECHIVHVKKSKAIKNDKVGIAQMSLDDIRTALKGYLQHDIFSDELPSFDEYLFLDLKLEGAGSKERRMKLVEKYHMPYTSSKKVEDFSLMLSLFKGDIEEIIEDE